ncbi:MAG: MBL fold metallo-hydrolase [Acidimicrobiales bacterium]
MCDDPSHHHGHEAARAVAHAAPRPITGEAVDPIPLQPVDRVTITVLIDNSYDALLGPGPHVRRGRSTAEVAVPTYEGGVGTDQLQAEHGFAALVTVERDGVARRLLFDTGVSPLGMVENLRRLDLDLGDIEIVVCSHGHYDHTGGFDGLVRRLGRPSLPVLIHPQFWRQRRSASPAVIRSSCRPRRAGRWRAWASRSSNGGSRRSCSTGRCSSPARWTAPPISSWASPATRAGTTRRRPGGPIRSSSTTRR